MMLVHVGCWIGPNLKPAYVEGQLCVAQVVVDDGAQAGVASVPLKWCRLLCVALVPVGRQGKLATARRYFRFLTKGPR